MPAERRFMRPALFLAALVCAGTAARADSPGHFLTVYYIPFDSSPIVGVSEKTIRQDAHVRFKVASDAGVSRVLKAVETDTPGGGFIRAHVRLLIERDEPDPDILVDAEGHVLRDGKQFALGPARFSALRALLQEIAPPIRLCVVVQPGRAQATPSAIAAVTITNVGAGPVALSKTHGFGVQIPSWLSLRIRSEDKASVWYPSGSPDLLLKLPKYVCLGPYEELKWEVDLLHWSPEFGGRREEQFLSFDLLRGRRYQLQAEYADRPDRDKRSGVRCPVFRGIVLSDWVDFTLPEASTENGTQ
jgi:hypothetical protein